ncbi:ankyrin repeat and SOCS box protein 9-like isoform X2 [Synchiropus splendidus]|uniref:ankyrin repeat and SOCS box protein 9-like isoform X2 n=1 Tax=Synchiropus splendidus TaxID=270530 RepID=UPI00237D577F|nr:ankyrin repeat and SOCS box protein 9-like isoform X2 [Synchiropus splendidus]
MLCLTGSDVRAAQEELMRSKCLAEVPERAAEERDMSACEDEQAPRFFSNALMSEPESDWSPVHDAAFNGRVLALRSLVAQGACVNLSTREQLTPLHAACLQGHAACVKVLLENAANVNLTSVDGHTALSHACGGGRASCAALLLRHGAAPGGSSPASSAMHVAAARGQPGCMEALVRHGADVDQRVPPSGSPLQVACSHQHLSAAEKLLQLGACVNSAASGDSPLHIAARLSHQEMLSLLLSHGADPRLRNREGKRPVDLAPAGSAAEQLLTHAGGPTLMQLCRLRIRRTLGRTRLGVIHELRLPTELQLYLLFQT